MKRIIAIIAITLSLVGISAAFAPSASACSGSAAYEAIACEKARSIGILVYKLTRIFF